MSRSPAGPEGTEETIAATRALIDSAPLAPAPRRRAGIPKKVGRFDIDRRLGSGGMGVVYEGHDPNLGRKVAIKVLHDRAKAQDRLLREAQALAQLTHENVVQVYEIDTADGEVFVAMQYIEGRTLHAWLRERERTWQEIVDMFAGAGAGLVAAHAKGIVHRDFKPDNVLIGLDEIPRVLDFGLARVVEAVEPGIDEPSVAALSASSSNPMLSADLTQTGSIMGTPAYMSPEQAAGAPVGAGSDQFSFCVALYEALYDQRPFEGASLATLIANLKAGRLRPRPLDDKLPDWLYAALIRGLSRNPSDRFASIEALLTELSAYRTASLEVGSKARVAFLLVSLLVLAGALGGNVLAVRGFGATVTPASTLPGSVVAIFVLLAALLAMRKGLRRSGINERIFACFLVYIFYGPSVRLAAWRLDMTMDQMMPLEALGGTLAGFMFALGFDRRLIGPAFAFFACALACLALPSRALEFHALGYFAYFGTMCLIWYRDGAPRVA